MNPLAKLSALLPSSQLHNETLIYVTATPAQAALVIGHNRRGFTVTAAGFPLSLLSRLLVHLETHLAAHGSPPGSVFEAPSVVLSTKNVAGSAFVLIGALRGQALPLAPIEAWLAEYLEGAGSSTGTLDSRNQQ